LTWYFEMASVVSVPPFSWNCQTAGDKRILIDPAHQAPINAALLRRGRLKAAVCVLAVVSCEAVLGVASATRDASFFAASAAALRSAFFLATSAACLLAFFFGA